MYSCTLYLTSALEGGWWSTTRPGRFTPGKDPASTVKEAGWAPRPVWTSAENLDLTGILSPGPSSPWRVADYAIPAHRKYGSPVNNNNNGHFEIFIVYVCTRFFLPNICHLSCTIFLNRRPLQHKSFGRVLHGVLKHIILKHWTLNFIYIIHTCIRLQWNV
jgi:hypothetical protein